LLSNANITDILVNGHKEVWIDQGQGLEKTKLTFLNEESVRSLAQKLALSTGRRLDQSQPYVDAQLTNSIRLHAVLSPLANPGTVISLRIHRPQILSLAELVMSVKHKANHAAEEAALITASTFDCERAIEIAKANDAEILTCELNSDYVYIETFSKFNNAQVSLFNQLGINDDGLIGEAKAK
jgi:type IV secretory pathway ATPase VirB11/archaellum biosynthesis ATPase